MQSYRGRVTDAERRRILIQPTYAHHMGGASSIAENTGMTRRDHISSERQGLISGVNMESSSVREAGAEERVASDQGREKDTRSDNSQEEKREQSFQPHSIRGLCTFDILCILRPWHPAKCTCTPSTDEMRGKAEEGESHALHGHMMGSVEFSKNIPVRGQPN